MTRPEPDLSGGPAPLSPHGRDNGEAQLVSDRWPNLAAELAGALRDVGEEKLAGQLSGLRVVEECGCGDDFCKSFYTRPQPDGAYGSAHRNIALSPDGPGMLVLDVVDDLIMYVEVIDRPYLG